MYIYGSVGCLPCRTQQQKQNPAVCRLAQHTPIAAELLLLVLNGSVALCTFLVCARCCCWLLRGLVCQSVGSIICMYPVHGYFEHAGAETLVVWVLGASLRTTA